MILQKKKKKCGSARAFFPSIHSTFFSPYTLALLLLPDHIQIYETPHLSRQSKNNSFLFWHNFNLKKKKLELRKTGNKNALKCLTERCLTCKKQFIDLACKHLMELYTFQTLTVITLLHTFVHSLSKQFNIIYTLRH